MIRFSCAALLLLGAALPAWADDHRPREIVQETTEELFERVDARRAHFEQNPDDLRALVRDLMLPKIDTEYSGRLVLGRESRGVAPEKVREFAEALSEMLVSRYADGLLEFETRDQVEVLPLQGENDERMTKVRTLVTLDNGQTSPVDYVFRKADGEWKIFDVIVEGISYVATFRNQIGEQVRREGFDATLDKLRRGEIEIDVEE